MTKEEFKQRLDVVTVKVKLSGVLSEEDKLEIQELIAGIFSNPEISVGMDPMDLLNSIQP